VAISAVEDCALTVWPWVDFAATFERDVEWERMRRRFAEMLYVRKENRELAFLLQDAVARYKGALAQFPAVGVHRCGSGRGLVNGHLRA
jgi:hypothetical protein